MNHNKIIIIIYSQIDIKSQFFDQFGQPTFIKKFSIKFFSEIIAFILCVSVVKSSSIGDKTNIDLLYFLSTCFLTYNERFIIAGYFKENHFFKGLKKLM